ncbi:MAG: hypothetical protein WB611_03080, partial [Stellaceae bacterium]
MRRAGAPTFYSTSGLARNGATNFGQLSTVRIAALAMSSCATKIGVQSKKLTFRQYQVLANVPEIQPTVMEQLSDRQFWH